MYVSCTLEQLIQMIVVNAFMLAVAMHEAEHLEQTCTLTALHCIRPGLDTNECRAGLRYGPPICLYAQCKVVRWSRMKELL